MTTAIITALEFPAHIFEVDGRILNGEVYAHEITELRDYARRDKFDLEAECQARYGYGSEWLSREQYKEISHERAEIARERWEREPKHVHSCPTCEDARYHFDKFCRHEAGDIEFECRACDEGTNVFYWRPGQ